MKETQTPAETSDKNPMSLRTFISVGLAMMTEPMAALVLLVASGKPIPGAVLVPFLNDLSLDISKTLAAVKTGNALDDPVDIQAVKTEFIKMEETAGNLAKSTNVVDAAQEVVNKAAARESKQDADDAEIHEMMTQRRKD